MNMASLFMAQKGELVARLAANPIELDAAQHLRYKIFYQELSATPDQQAHQSQRDIDDFDQICDHLLVVRQAAEITPEMIGVEGGELVGTYRLLGHNKALASNGFYSQKEFDLAPLIARKQNHKFLELGRSCVLQPYRTKPVVELLWQGIWNYLRLHNLDVMFGCASLAGTDVEDLQLPLSFLQQFFKPPADWNVTAHKHCRADFTPLPTAKINERQALKALPPLIKGYLRLGAYIGTGAVFDRQFNTTDVLIILPVSAIDPRYFARFGSPNKKPPA